MRKFWVNEPQRGNPSIRVGYLFKLPALLALILLFNLCGISITALSSPLSEFEEILVFEDWEEIKITIEQKPVVERNLTDWQVLGYASLAVEDYPSAQAAFEQLPDNGAPGTEELIEFADNLAAKYPNMFRPKLLKADALARFKDYEQAVSILDDAISKAQFTDPIDDRLLANDLNGTIQALNGDLDSARYHFQEALEINPGFADAQLGIANIDALSGNISSAINCYDDIALSNPDFEMVNIAKVKVSSHHESGVSPVPWEEIPGYNSPVPSKEELEKYDEYWTSGQYWESDPYYKDIKGLDSITPLTPESYVKAYSLVLEATAVTFAYKFAGGILNAIKELGDEIIPFTEFGRKVWDSAWMVKEIFDFVSNPKSYLKDKGTAFDLSKAYEAYVQNWNERFAVETGMQDYFKTTPKTDSLTGTADARGGLPQPKNVILHQPPQYHIATSEAYSTGEWNIIPDTGNWVLVGHASDERDNYIPVLLTSEEDSPQSIAKTVKERNDREHPDRKAIIIIEGDPESPKNKEIIQKLKDQGYGDGDIFAVVGGDLYSSSGELIQRAEIVRQDGSPSNNIHCLGMWGYYLRSAYGGRPVYAITLYGKAVDEIADDEPDINETERKLDDVIYVNYIPFKRPEPPPYIPYDFSFPEIKPPPGISYRLPPSSIPDYDRGGVYTVDERNLEMVEGDEAGTGFIFGDSDGNEGTSSNEPPPLRIPFLIFPNKA